MNLIFQLFFQFFYIGLFSFGGGYATLPFLYEIVEKYHWYSLSQLTDMISLSSVTPGPIGINMATFAGYMTSGVLGSMIATFAIVLPSYIIVTLVYKIMDKFQNSTIVKGVIKALKPAGCALLSSVGIKLLFTSEMHLFGTILFLVLLSISFYKKMDTVFYLGISALVGVILGCFNFIGV